MSSRTSTPKVKTYKLELFVSGLTSKSIRTIETLRKICEDHIPDSYTLKIIDIYKDPALAKENDVIAVPTLIKRSPGPKRVFIGDLTDTSTIYSALGIRRKGKENGK